MAEAIFDQDDRGFTFSDQDFERRYYSADTSVSSAPPANNVSRSLQPPVDPGAGPGVGSRNRFMRTLLRRRFFSFTSI